MLQTKPIFSLRKQKPKTRLSLSLWSPKPSENHQPLLKPPALIPLTPLTEPIGNSCGLTGYSRCVETTKRTGSSRLGDPLSKRLVIVTRGGLRDYVAACGPPDREKRWVTKTTSLCFLFFLWVINLVGSPGKNIWLPYIFWVISHENWTDGVWLPRNKIPNGINNLHDSSSLFFSNGLTTSQLGNININCVKKV